MLITDFPPELLVKLILFLDISEIEACETTCTYFRTIIHTSAQIQYAKALLLSLRLDCYLPDDPTPYTERLARLARSEAAWRSLTFTAVGDLPDQVLMRMYRKPFDGHKISGGYLVTNCRPSSEQKFAALSWARLPSPSGTRNSSSRPNQAVSGHRKEPDIRRLEGSWHVAMEHDVLLSVELILAQDKFPVVKVSSAKLRSKHPKAKHRMYKLKLKDPELMSTQHSSYSLPSSLGGDTLAFLARSSEPDISRAILLDRKTGSKISHRHDGHYSQDIVFLSPDIYAVFNLALGAIELCRKSDTNPPPRVRFLLPDLRDEASWNTISVESPRTMVFPTPSEGGDVNPFDPTAGLLILHVQIQKMAIGEGMVGEVLFQILVINASALLYTARTQFEKLPQAMAALSSSGKSLRRSLSSFTSEFKWGKWGPPNTRFYQDIYPYKIYGPRLLRDRYAGTLADPNRHYVEVFDFSPAAVRYGRWGRQRTNERSAKFVAERIAAEDLAEKTGEPIPESEWTPEARAALCASLEDRPSYALVDEASSLSEEARSYYREDVVTCMPYLEVERDFRERMWNDFIFDEYRVVTQLGTLDPQVFVVGS